MSDLEDVLAGKAGEPEATGVTETKEVEASPTPGEQETRSPEAEEPQGEPVNWEERAKELEREQAGLRAAAAAERHKRQEMEQRMQKPEFWDNPEAVIQHELQQVEARNRERFLNMSESLVRTQHPDYDDMRSVFIELAQNDPVLIRQLDRAENPAMFAYQTATAEMQRRQFGSFEQAVEARAAELLKAKEAELKAKVNAIPDSITEIRGATGTNSTSYAPPSLSDIVD